MNKIEFEVKGKVPPRNVGKSSMWNDKTEVPRIIELRKKAFESFKGMKPFSENIKLDIEIHIPKDYNKPGDLDNFIKGICDGLSRPKEAMIQDTFTLHESFEHVDNLDFHPDNFSVIEDDELITQIIAKKIMEESGELFYRIQIEGS